MTVPVDYTARDFATVRQSMIDRISSLLPAWTSRSSSDFGIVLIELLAYEIDKLSYYSDRVLNEAFLDTAQLRSSVESIAAMLGYSPGIATPSTATVTFDISASAPGPQVVPAGTIVSRVRADGTAPVFFTTDADSASTAAGATSTPVAVTEGTVVTDEALGTSSGDDLQIYQLYHLDAYKTYVEVSVNPGSGAVLWTRVESLLDYGPTDQVYTVEIDRNGATFVQFGDDVNGKVPASGSAITATYRYGQGSFGNVEAGGINNLVSVVNYVTAVTSDTAATGGSDPESLDDIKLNAPKAFAATNRAVTLQDYETLALQVAGVDKAYALYDVYSDVYLFIASSDSIGVATSAALKTSVENYFSDKLLAGVNLTVEDIQYIGVDISVDVAVLPNYRQTEVATAVELAIADALSFVKQDIDDPVNLSEVYRAMNSVAGVDYGVVTLFAYDDASEAGVATSLGLSGNYLVLSSAELLGKTGFTGDGTLDGAGQTNGIASVGSINVTATGGVV